MFESFAPLERVLPLAYRHPLRARHAVVTGCGDPRRAGEIESAAYQTATSALSSTGLLRAYVDWFPPPGIRAIGSWGESAGPERGPHPLGVAAGMVFAMLTRASFSARVTWFQSLVWARASRMLRGLRPTPPEDVAAGDAVPGFEKIPRPGAFDSHFDHRLVRPGDKFRVWGVNSFVQSPAFGGTVREDIAQQCGYRVTEEPLLAKGANPAYGWRRRTRSRPSPFPAPAW